VGKVGLKDETCGVVLNLHIFGFWDEPGFGIPHCWKLFGVKTMM
jgi:hypothetical protein